jgi:hypothetical protein
MKRKTMLALVGTAALLVSMSVAAEGQDPRMSFFVTSAGPGNGGDLGGLEGADAHCKALAKAAGAPDRDWRAYLSTEEDGKRGVFARSRIGTGPWYNAQGILIAADVHDLHMYNKTITLETALDEHGRAQRARHPDRYDGRRYRLLPRRQGPHLQELDEQRRGQRAGRSSRPPRRWQRVVELGPRQPRLQPGGPDQDRRRRVLLLLRCGLNPDGGRERGQPRSRHVDLINGDCSPGFESRRWRRSCIQGFVMVQEGRRRHDVRSAVR